jgi:hypothetical protein
VPLGAGGLAAAHKQHAEIKAAEADVVAAHALVGALDHFSEALVFALQLVQARRQQLARGDGERLVDAQQVRFFLFAVALCFSAAER